MTFCAFCTFLCVWNLFVRKQNYRNDLIYITTLGFRICQVLIWYGSKYASLLNIPGFWIYKRSEYTRVLNMPQVLNIPGFSICLGSEYARVLNIPVFLICLWVWICHSYDVSRVLAIPGSEYDRVLNNARVTQGFEYAWIIHEHTWLCLNMSDYAQICVNMPNFACLAFVLHFLVVIPCLLERVVTCFNVYPKLEVIV